ncbi:hypothetical protein MHU86_24274 [Fragilaria crotonensis]|nr:hypothetical protein MHU86_24274 [Fragilaria crotonensis]
MISRQLFFGERIRQTRHQLDARNSDVRPPTAFQLIADRWNDEHFNPIAAVSECHEDFSVPTNCGHSQVVTLMRATPQKVEDTWHRFGQAFFASSKTGRSGQGEGGRHAGTDDDEEQDGREESDDPEEFIIFDTSSVRFGSLSERVVLNVHSRTEQPFSVESLTCSILGSS